MNATQSLAGWMVYAMCLSAFIGLLAAGAEEAVRRRGISLRALWGVSLAAALLLPLVVWGSVRGGPRPAVAVSDVAPSDGRVAVTQVGGGTPARVGSTPKYDVEVWPALMTWRDAARIPNLARLDASAGIIAIASPIVCALWLAVAWLRLRAQRREWREEMVDGTAVLLSSNFGPAIVGLRHPRIVVPEWAMHLSASERHLIIAHEQEHLAAHDGRAVTLALCAVALMPWNVALWRVVRRFRLAVELDCDTRLLRTTPDVRQYGVLLLEVARHTPTGSAMVAALVERPSALRRRIEAMTARGRASLGRVLRDVSGIACATAALCIIAPPRAQTPPAAFVAPSEVVASADTSPSRPASNDIIRGVVSAPDGTPIENVLVKAIDQLSGVMISSRTNANGRYTLSVANGDGDYLMTLSDPGDGYRDTTIAVKRSAPGQVLVANVTLTRSSAVSGDANRSAATPSGVPGRAVASPPRTGTTDILRGAVTAPDNTPIANAVVGATAQVSGIEAHTRTNAAGRYTLFIANGDGAYRLAISAAGYNDTIVEVKRDSTEDILWGDVMLTKSHQAPDVPALVASQEVPMPIPAPVRGTSVVAQFFVNAQGLIDTLRFTPTPDSVYNARLEATLRTFRFRPATTADGTPIAAWWKLTYTF